MSKNDEIHRKMAKDLFNKVWDLLDKKERSAEEDHIMIHAAHGSRYHWGEIGTSLEAERGEWQISRVYSVLNRYESALYHGKICLETCQSNNIEDFDLAFAYEAMARAYAIGGDKEKLDHYYELAESAGKKIDKKEDRDYFLGDLKFVKEIK